MKIVTAFLMGLVISVPVGVASFTISANMTDSRWEYKTQYLQEELDACHLRDKFEGLRH